MHTKIYRFLVTFLSSIACRLFLCLYIVHTIQDVFTVEQLIQLREGGGDYRMMKPNAGILFAYLTSLDIDKDPQTLVNSRWYVVSNNIQTIV